MELFGKGKQEARGRHARVDQTGPKHARPGSDVSVISTGQKAVLAAASAVFAIGVGVSVLPIGTPVAADSGLAYGEPAAVPDFNVRDVDGTVSDAELLRFGEVVSDGSSMDGGVAYGIVEAPASYAGDVPEILQENIMRGGCEVVSLSMVLQSMGFDADPVSIADHYLDMDGHFASGYAGSPYTSGGGYPPGLVKAANLYLEEKGSPVRAHDISGTTFAGLQALVANGYPVMVWSTMYFSDPMWANVFEDGIEWYDNEHCVVLYGLTDEGALVSDPIDGYVVRDADDFARIYEECGSMAVAIY